LARYVNTPDGLDKDVALQAAEQRLQSIRPDAMNEIAVRVDRLGVLITSAMGDLNPEQAREVFDAANAVYSVVGTFGGAFLGRVSQSLCELLDRSIERGCWCQEAVLLHYQAMQLTRQKHALPRAEQEQIILGLERVKEKVLSA
jgi:hypothetical protein